MSIISNTLLSGANDPGIKYGANPTVDPLVKALRMGEGSDRQSNIASFGNSGNQQRNTANALSQSNQGGSGNFGLGTMGKAMSMMGGPIGTVGNVMSTVDALRNTDFSNLGPRDVIGGLGKGLTALGAVNPVFGALGGAVNLGTSIYDSTQKGWLGDAFNSRPEESAWDALENAGYGRADIREIMGAKTESLQDYYDRGGEGPSSAGYSGTDRESKPGGMGGV